MLGSAMHNNESLTYQQNEGEICNRSVSKRYFQQADVASHLDSIAPLRQMEEIFSTGDLLGQRQEKLNDDICSSTDECHTKALHDIKSHFVYQSSMQDELLMGRKAVISIASDASYTLRRAHRSSDSIHQTSLEGVPEQNRTRIRTLSFSQFRESLRSNHKKPDCNSNTSTAA